MQKSQLVNVLRTFSKKEIRDCRKWLDSPYHNQRKDCRLLFEYLCSHLQNKNALQKEVVYKNIFPKMPFDDAHIRQVMYFLLKTIEDFLIYEAFKENRFESKMQLAQCYRKRGMKSAYNKALKTTHKVHQNSPFKNEKFFDNELALLREEHLGLSQERSTNTNLQEISSKLDRAFIVAKLKQACLMAADQNVYKVVYDLGMLPNLLEYIKGHQLLDIPTISIYYYMYLISSIDSDDKSFTKAKALMFKHTNLFSNSEASDIYLMAINYCAIQINKGKRKFILEAFKIYQTGIENRIFILDGKIDRFLFRNIVTAGAYLKEYDWLEQFVKDYEQFLDPKYRDDYVNLSQSMILYNKKDYDKALLILTQYDFKDTLISLTGRGMLIKIYYESKETSALDSLLDSASVFLKRKKDITNNYKLLYNNLIKFTKKLLRVNPYDKKKRAKLKQEILDANPLIEKRWFLEQLEKL